MEGKWNEGLGGIDGSYMLVYTTEEGGPLKALHCSADQFDEAVKTGTLETKKIQDDVPIVVNLAYAALVAVVENHDFILGCSRDDREGIIRHAKRKKR